MALLEQWQKIAYNEKTDRGELQRFWQRYFLLEKGVYEKLLTNPDEKVEGTVKELADKYNLSVMEMTGFLDGINDSLVEPNPIDTMELSFSLPYLVVTSIVSPFSCFSSHFAKNTFGANL